MKKSFGILLVLLFIATITGSAEKWTPVSVSGDSSTSYIDLTNIRPVVTSDGEIVPDIYYLKNRHDFGNNILWQDEMLVDVRNGAVMFISLNGSKNLPEENVAAVSSSFGKWENQQEGHSALYDYGYIYSHKTEILSRPPYTITNLPENRSPLFPVSNDGWQTAFQIPNKIVLMNQFFPGSVQISQPNGKKLPTLRFLLIQTAFPLKDLTKKSELLWLAEVNTNYPQKYTLTMIGMRKDGNSRWSKLKQVKSSTDFSKPRPFNSDSAIAFVGTAAFEYFFTHPEEVVARGYFVPGKNEKSINSWLELVNQP